MPGTKLSNSLVYKVYRVATLESYQGTCTQIYESGISAKVGKHAKPLNWPVDSSYLCGEVFILESRLLFGLHLNCSDSELKLH